MRITADIIDEDVAPECDKTANICPKTVCAEKSILLEEVKDRVSKSNETYKKQYRKHCETYKDICSRFRNLKISGEQLKDPLSALWDPLNQHRQKIDTPAQAKGATSKLKKIESATDDSYFDIEKMDTPAQAKGAIFKLKKFDSAMDDSCFDIEFSLKLEDYSIYKIIKVLGGLTGVSKSNVNKVDWHYINLTEWFSLYGKVLECEILDDGRAHVLMSATKEKAKDALECLNGCVVKNKKLNVQRVRWHVKNLSKCCIVGRERPSSPCLRSKIQTSAKSTLKVLMEDQLYIKNLPDGCTKDDLGYLFSKYGRVIDIFIRDSYHAHVIMNTVAQAKEAANKLNNCNLKGSCISVELYVKGYHDLKSEIKELVECSEGLFCGNHGFKREVELLGECPAVPFYENEIYIKNLSAGFTKYQLENFFSLYGKVTHIFIGTDCAHVTMNTGAEAARAVKKLNNCGLMGSFISAQLYLYGYRKCKEASLLPECSRGPNYENELYIKNLPAGCTEDDLKNLFSGYGNVVHVSISTNSAYVTMSTGAQAQEVAKKLNNYNLKGSYISIQLSLYEFHPVKKVHLAEFSKQPNYMQYSEESARKALNRGFEAPSSAHSSYPSFSNSSSRLNLGKGPGKTDEHSSNNNPIFDSSASMHREFKKWVDDYPELWAGNPNLVAATVGAMSLSSSPPYFHKWIDDHPDLWEANRNLVAAAMALNSALPHYSHMQYSEESARKALNRGFEAPSPAHSSYPSFSNSSSRLNLGKGSGKTDEHSSNTNPMLDPSVIMHHEFKKWIDDHPELLAANPNLAAAMALNSAPPFHSHDFILNKKMDEAKASSSKGKSDLEFPSQWMMEYLLKMKQEIKEEILEELTNLPRIEMQGHCTPNGKVDENQYQGEVIHPGVFCDSCDQLIHGIRYKCGNCTDYDLCQECESLPNIHNKNHIFLKIRFPVSLKLFQKQKWQPFILPSTNELLTPGFKSHSPKKLYEAKFVCDETVPDGTVLAPSTRFIKSWRVLNSGKRVWTHSTKLQHIQGSVGLTPASEQADVPHLRPGEEGVVSVLFTTPAVPGVYRSHWNFCHKSRPFGHIVWCHIVVKEPEPEEKQVEITSEVLNLHSKGLPSEKEKEVASIAKVLTAVKEEHERGNMIPRKLAVNSHTATPNNTPFDLTPPKSPDHQAMNELKVVVEDKESVPSLPVVESDAEEVSVVSLSSSDSDAEFVVIPMPNCFNLSESFASRNVSHLSQYLQSENVGDQKDSKPSVPKVVKPQNLHSASVKPAFSAETVSQETGVPELSEHSASQSEVGKESEQQVLISHNVSADGSSSEISIIESGENSPISENSMPISSIHIAVTTNDTESKTSDESVLGERRNSLQQEVPERDDQTTDIPGSSATFPKFPVEGITSIYEPASSANTEERTVQVLPERIVTVPLNVASTVYNATMQVMTNLRRQYSDAQNNQEGATGVTRSTLSPVDQLVEMGFCNRQQNEELLKKHKNDVSLVVGELVNLSDNDWYASRHVPPSAPTYN